MTLQLGIYTSVAGVQLLDATYRASNVSFSSGEHGNGELSAFIRVPLADAFRLYDHQGLLHVSLSEHGRVIWEGRAESVSIQRGGVQIAALGYWRALSDAPHTALWSLTKTDAFRALTLDDRAGSRAEKFEIDTQSRLMIMQKKGESYTTSTIGRVGYEIPHLSSRNIIGVSFDYEVLLPTQYGAQLISSASTSFAGSVTSEWTITGTGALLTGSKNLATTSGVAVFFQLAPNTSHTFASETGDFYVKITNIRLVTRLDNRINTTFTANRNAGASVTATVGTTARMYAGQRLTISNAAGTTSESVIVASVTNSTQFVSTFVNSYVTGGTVQAHVIYPDEIALRLALDANTLNGQLSSSSALIQSPSIDLLDETYEDELPSDILSRLAALGDSQSTPRKWEVGVYDRRELFFRPVSADARTWYVDITNLQLEKTIDALVNSVYVKYQSADNRTLRSAANADSVSVARFGLTRRTGVDTTTTSAVQANIQRDMVLSDKKDPPPKAQIEFIAVYGSGGGRYALTMPRAGDTFVIRNLPVGTVANIDKIRTFRVSRVEYSADSNTLTVEPETPPDTLEFALARKEKGIR